MDKRLLPGQYYITSLQNNENLGVSQSLPVIPPLPVPVMILRPGVLPPEFTVEVVNGGDNTYVIKVERRNTRGRKDRVFAFADQPAEEWVILYREYNGAYTIERRDQPVGWTVQQPEGVEDRQVVLSPVVSTRSIPPQFRPTQLFRFESAGPQE
ncbi:hypothetical protein F5J12DRAFT_571133 [Pisolithus orientalis]|uniref:uncharacterized protein n=1 Tax=Pisolithus orientalis TaxID=936130 RepID=UPI0022255DF5|nr:uncharacterized protein F5J12DRAFT_571133 [Pisolithus orientalis]KAI6010931.1 hypothetical protein F5J12DRAFT_571133 [Pisolithus orientalis]